MIRIQANYVQFLALLAAMSNTKTVLYVVTDGVVAHVAVLDPKMGGAKIELIGDTFPTVAAFLLQAAGAIEVAGLQ